MNKQSKILVACEESGIVTMAFRSIGFTNVWSCDIEPTSGNHPEWHLQQNVLPLLKESWDMIIAFPPCTHICSSGARWFAEKLVNGKQQEGIDFFIKFTETSCPRVAIENPVGIMSTVFRKPDQIIQPWQFGHGELKTTCLWLKGLPKLQPTNIVSGKEQRIWKLPPSPNRAKIRSRTFVGIGKAMALQWGGVSI